MELDENLVARINAYCRARGCSPAQCAAINYVCQSTKIGPEQAQLLLSAAKWDPIAASDSFHRAVSKQNVEDAGGTERELPKRQSSVSSNVPLRVPSTSPRRSVTQVQMKLGDLLGNNKEKPAQSVNLAFKSIALTHIAKSRNLITVGAKPFRFHLDPNISIYVQSVHDQKSMSLHAVGVRVDQLAEIRTGWIDGGFSPRIASTFEFDEFTPRSSWIKFTVYERRTIRGEKKSGEAIWKVSTLFDAKKSQILEFGFSPSPVTVYRFKGFIPLDAIDGPSGRISVEILMSLRNKKFLDDLKEREAAVSVRAGADEASKPPSHPQEPEIKRSASALPSINRLPIERVAQPLEANDLPGTLEPQTDDAASRPPLTAPSGAAIAWPTPSPDFTTGMTGQLQQPSPFSCQHPYAYGSGIPFAQNQGMFPGVFNQMPAYNHNVMGFGGTEGNLTNPFGFGPTSYEMSPFFNPYFAGYPPYMGSAPHSVAHPGHFLGQHPMAQPSLAPMAQPPQTPTVRVSQTLMAQASQSPMAQASQTPAVQASHNPTANLGVRQLTSPHGRASIDDPAVSDFATEFSRQPAATSTTPRSFAVPEADESDSHAGEQVPFIQSEGHGSFDVGGSLSPPLELGSRERDDQCYTNRDEWQDDGECRESGSERGDDKYFPGYS